MDSYEDSLRISKINTFYFNVFHLGHEAKVNSLHTSNIVLNQLLNDHPFSNQASVAIVRNFVLVIAASAWIIMLNKSDDWYMKAKNGQESKKLTLAPFLFRESSPTSLVEL